MEILRIKDLTFRYPDTDTNALDGVDISVESGEFVCLFGESGCGKTTLLKLIKKELAPFGTLSGEIHINDTDDGQGLGIGFVMQDPESQTVTDKVWHELAFGLESLGAEPGLIRRRAAEAASYFGIDEWIGKKTSELSGGQKQLLSLASVMAAQPGILLLDEPTAQLDPVAAEGFISTLSKLNRELGVTVIIAEHRLEDVFPAADRAIYLKSGKVGYSGAPRNFGKYLRTHPDDPCVNGLPASMRIAVGIDEKGELPLTVREGRRMVARFAGAERTKAPEKPVSHGKEKRVELSDIWFRFEKNSPDVLKGLSMTVYGGEHFCILGGNGAGKTTVLSVIAGLYAPYRGAVSLFGQRIARKKDRTLKARGIALLPQDPKTLFLESTVQDELLKTCKLRGTAADNAQREISDTAEFLGISGLLSRHPYDLSGGEQQKAALAKLLLLKPRLLLLDDPTKGLDANAERSLAAVIRGLAKNDVTVVTVTHDVEFAAASADRCGLLFDGGFVSEAVPSEFFSRNSFYTTAASRISRDVFENAVLCEDVIGLCRASERPVSE